MCQMSHSCTFKFQSIILIGDHLLFKHIKNAIEQSRLRLVAIVDHFNLDQDLILTTIQLSERKMPIQMEVDIRPR